MSKDLLWKLTCLAAVLGGAAAMVFAAGFGGCDGMIETAQGGEVPMKCHWTQSAAAWLALIPAACGIGGFLVRDKAGRRALGAVLGISAVCQFVIPSDMGIGVCAMKGMACHTMAGGLKAAAVCLLIAAVIQLIRPGAGERPRRDF